MALFFYGRILKQGNPVEARLVREDVDKSPWKELARDEVGTFTASG